MGVNCYADCELSINYACTRLRVLYFSFPLCKLCVFITVFSLFRLGPDPPPLHTGYSFGGLTVVCKTKWDETKWKSVVCEMEICSLRNGNL